MEFLHNHNHGTLPITEQVLVAVAANVRRLKTFETILGWTGGTVLVTDAVLAAIASNGGAEWGTFEYVLGRLSPGVQITENVILAVALNRQDSELMVAMLIKSKTTSSYSRRISFIVYSHRCMWVRYIEY